MQKQVVIDKKYDYKAWLKLQENPDADWVFKCKKTPLVFDIPEIYRKKLVDALCSSTTLRKLQIQTISRSSNEIFVGCFRWLNSLLSRTTLLIELQLNINAEGTMTLLTDALRNNSTLKKVIIHFELTLNASDTKEFLDMLINHPTINRLSVVTGAITKDTADLWREFLAQTTTLKSLELRWTKSYELILDGIRRNKSLTELALSSYRLTDQLQSIVDIVLSKPHIKHISLDGQTIEKAQHVAAICKLLKANQLDAFDLPAFADNESKSHILEALQHDVTIKKLILPVANWSDDNGAKIGAWIQKSKMIEHVGLANNEFDENTCKAIGTAIHNHPSLKKLDLSQNPLYGDSIMWICEGLKQNESLQKLKISLPLSDVLPNRANICDMLKANKSLLCFLFIGSMKIHAQFIEMIIEAVATHNKTIEKIQFKVESKDVELRKKLDAILSNNKLEKQRDWLVLSHNIARSVTRHETLPAEIWLLICSQAIYRGMPTEDLTKVVFKKYKLII